MSRALLVFFLFLSVLSSKAQYSDSLKLAIKTAKHDTVRGKLLILLSEAVYDENFDTIIPLCEQAIALANKNLATAKGRERKAFLWIKSAGLNNKGYITHELGDNLKALESYNKALAIDEEMGDQAGIAVDLNNIATILTDQGNIQQALEYDLRGLKIREKLKDSLGMAYAFHNIGVIYETLGEADRAFEYFKKSLSIKEQLRDSDGIANSYNSFASIYIDKRETVKAMDYYQKCLDLRLRLKYKPGIANVYNNIGAAYSKMKQPEKALEYYEKALSMREESKEKDGIAFTCFNIGLAMRDLNRSNESKVYFERSLKLAYELGTPEYISNASGELALLYAKDGKWKEAYEMEKVFKEMNDSITNLSVRKSALQKSFQYEYGKKAAADSVRAGEEKKVYEARAEKEKTQRFALIGGLILVVGFAGFMVNRFRLIQKQKNIIEEKNREILDSIHYAKRIQNSLLTNEKYIARAIDRLKSE